jgi:protein-tyrosine-phosphatase
MRPMDLTERARLHAALGDPLRLRMVESLLLGDRTFQELAEAAGLPGNAAAYHLAVLDKAGLIERQTSEGDRRRRYFHLCAGRIEGLGLPAPRVTGAVLFVCTHNSARSQFAAALWNSRTGGPVDSAGTEPAGSVHPRAVEAADAYGLDLRASVPKGYEAVADRPELVVSVCDRAHEAGHPFDAPMLHWSIPDPVLAGTKSAFRSAFAEIATRVDRMARVIPI